MVSRPLERLLGKVLAEVDDGVVEIAVAGSTLAACPVVENGLLIVGNGTEVLVWSVFKHNSQAWKVRYP